MNKETIFFDLDRTLVDTTTVNENCKNATLISSGIDYQAYDECFHAYRSTLEFSTDFNPVNFLNMMSKKSGIEKSKLAMGFWNKDNFCIYPEVFEVLSKLAENNNLAIFSEGVRDEWQIVKIKNTKIKKFFDLKISLIERRKLDIEVIAKIPFGATVIDDKKMVIEKLYETRPDLKLYWVNRIDQEKIENDRVATIRNLRELI